MTENSGFPAIALVRNETSGAPISSPTRWFWALRWRGSDTPDSGARVEPAGRCSVANVSGKLTEKLWLSCGPSGFAAVPRACVAENRPAGRLPGVAVGVSRGR